MARDLFDDPDFDVDRFVDGCDDFGAEDLGALDEADLDLLKPPPRPAPPPRPQPARKPGRPRKKKA